MKFLHINSAPVGYVSVLALVIGFVLFNLALSRIPVDISPTEIARELPKPSSAEKLASTRRTDIDFDVQDTLSRPVFSPTRREFEQVAAPIAPQPESIAPAPPVAVSIPAFRLQGIRKIGADLSALLSISEGEQPRWLAVGDALEGWTLEHIDIHDVALRSGDQFAVVDLYPAENQDVPQN
ncbi:hypothetical protein CO659_16585 [Rhizobium sp. S9]|uniref:hypothetical protein n=1 Tax=unclassified Rhizobium TaxID=2613769 RepID=UPI000A21041D|nr:MULTISPECIES: hypothetical protein [unclassified Rhizobium]ARO26436.1 hypothetical protein TAL182_PB00088 [Rhizobium sp. TAL182]PDS96534.1 hypothetical protein CO659_16585 [Rhizobium sp. S9]